MFREATWAISGSLLTFFLPSWSSRGDYSAGAMVWLVAAGLAGDLLC
jgi:hypothetical protein